VWLRDQIGTKSIRLVQLSGGSVHNTIPNFAEAFVALDIRKIVISGELVSSIWKTFQAEYAKTDTNLVLNLTEVDGRTDFKRVGCMTLKKKFTFGRVFSAGTEEKLIELIQGLPHGVYRMSDTIPELVETSNNLAVVRTVENEVKIILSQRSSITSKLAEITWGVEALAKLVGARIEYEKYYPAWEPDPESGLLSNCKQIYTGTFGKEPEVTIVHAGLECGLIGSKFRDLEMISFGPTIKDPHSPAERIFIPSIERVWIFLENLLQSYR
jgi:dipeptidase D